MQFQVLKYFKLQPISVHANSSGTATPACAARNPGGCRLPRPYAFQSWVSLVFRVFRERVSPTWLLALHCHPSPIRAKRGWVRDLLLLLPLRASDPLKCKGRSFDFSRRPPLAVILRSAATKDLSSPLLVVQAELPPPKQKRRGTNPAAPRFSSLKLLASRSSKYRIAPNAA